MLKKWGRFMGIVELEITINYCYFLRINTKLTNVNSYIEILQKKLLQDFSVFIG